MNPKMAVVLGIMLVLQVTSSQSTDMFQHDNSKAVEVVASSINQFSAEFYEAITKTKSEDFICSPLSAAMVLMMAASGAQGRTAMEMNAVLHNRDNSHSGIHSLISQLNNMKSVDLHLANKIFVANDFPIKDSFLATSMLTFQSDIQNLNFGESDNACKIINDWCEAQTKSRIKDIVQPRDISGDTVLVLVNAVYFKGMWEQKFDPKETKLRPFHLNDKQTKNVPMMYKEGVFRYGALPQIAAKFIEIPYESTEISEMMSMIIILPDDVNGLSRVEANLHNVSRSELMSGAEYEVKLYMPKFKIESTIDLKPILRSMGMEEMFMTSADFGGIVESKNGTTSLKVDKIVQKAFIEVNEEGSEAAAATAAELVNRFGEDTPRKNVTFDVSHPFLVQIVNEHVVLFSSRVASLNP